MKLRDRGALLGLAVALAGYPAWSQGRKSKAEAKENSDENGAEFKKRIAAGQKKVSTRDFVGAIDEFRNALTEEPTNCIGHYFLGAAQVLKGDPKEAELAWQMGVRYTEKKDKWKGRFLFVLADLQERQGKVDEAKAAWATYLKFLNEHPQLKGYDGTAEERRRVIDVHNELIAQYAPVRRRIEQRLKEASKPPAGTDR